MSVILVPVHDMRSAQVIISSHDITRFPGSPVFFHVHFLPRRPPFLSLKPPLPSFARALDRRPRPSATPRPCWDEARCPRSLSLAAGRRERRRLSRSSPSGTSGGELSRGRSCPESTILFEFVVVCCCSEDRPKLQTLLSRQFKEDVALNGLDM